MFIFRSYVLMRLRWACKRPFPRRPIVPLVLVGSMERAAGHWGTSGREVSGHELGARGCRRFSVAAGLCPVKKRLGDLEATVDQPTVDSDAPGGVRLAARP